MLQPYIGPYLDAFGCPACGVWDVAVGPHAATCALMAALHQYAADCASGRAQEPDYWVTMDELDASLAAGQAVR